MKNYRFVGKTSKETFLIKGINVFNERWIHEGSCAPVPKRQTAKALEFTNYISEELNLFFKSCVV